MSEEVKNTTVVGPHSILCDPLDHSTTSIKPAFHIIIIGAGITGLATAILLRKAHYKVIVLEKDDTITQVRQTSKVD